MITQTPKQRARMSQVSYKSRPQFFLDAKRKSADALCLFLDGGLVVSFYEDSVTVAEVFGLHAWQSDSGPAKAARGVSFPKSVLERNVAKLEELGYRVKVTRKRVLSTNKYPKRRRYRTPPGYQPTPKAIAKAAAAIREGWDENTEQDRAGTGAVVSASFATYSTMPVRIERRQFGNYE
jgi:hypothetical protein